MDSIYKVNFEIRENLYCKAKFCTSQDTIFERQGKLIPALIDWLTGNNPDEFANYAPHKFIQLNVSIENWNESFQTPTQMIKWLGELINGKPLSALKKEGAAHALAMLNKREECPGAPAKPPFLPRWQ